MGRISLDLPDPLFAAAAKKAEQGGFENVESYLTALLESEVATTDEALEALLLQRLDDPRPSMDATDEFWRDLKSTVRTEIDRKGRAAS